MGGGIRNMTKGDIITKFELYMDDTTELSSQEESDLFDKIYSKVCDERPWQFARSAGTGTTSISVPYIALPSDFSYIANDGNRTDIASYAEGPIVFVGPNLSPYRVINFSDRRQYTDQDGYVYVDIANLRLYFTKQPASALAVEFDYQAVPASLTTTQSPAFPARFHDVLYHGMCSDDFIIQQSDKAKSYASEHKGAYDGYISRMALWDSRLVQLN